MALSNLLYWPARLKAEPPGHRVVLSLAGGPERIPSPSPTLGMKPQRRFFTLQLMDAQDGVRSWGPGSQDVADARLGGAAMLTEPLHGPATGRPRPRSHHTASLHPAARVPSPHSC